jgi:tRNA(adenine34) deaminase
MTFDTPGGALCDDLACMRLALREAEAALATGDVPVGAVIARERRVIATGRNRREADRDPTAHAEMIAIRAAAAALGTWRLDDVTLYVTLEPCPMCAGAIVLARIRRVVFAALEPKTGAAGSVVDLLRHDRLPHRCDVDVGLLSEESAALLRQFFADQRSQSGVQPCSGDRC